MPARAGDLISLMSSPPSVGQPSMVGKVAPAVLALSKSMLAEVLSITSRRFLQGGMTSPLRTHQA